MDAELKQIFERDGFVSEIDVLDAKEVAGYRQHLEQLIAQHADHPEYGQWTYFKAHLVLSWVADIASAPALLDALEMLIGPDILLWNSFIPAKPPKTEGHFGWHQDGRFTYLAPLEKTVTVWLALNHVSQANGGMRMLAGSHEAGLHPHELTCDEASMLRRRSACYRGLRCLHQGRYQPAGRPGVDPRPLCAARLARQ